MRCGRGQGRHRRHTHGEVVATFLCSPIGARFGQVRRAAIGRAVKHAAADEGCATRLPMTCSGRTTWWTPVREHAGDLFAESLVTITCTCFGMTWPR